MAHTGEAFYEVRMNLHHHGSDHGKLTNCDCQVGEGGFSSNVQTPRVRLHITMIVSFYCYRPEYMYLIYILLGLLQPETSPLDNTRFSEVPWFMSPISLVAVLVLIAALLGIIFQFVYGKREGYGLWSKGDSGPLGLINRNIYSWIPAIILIGLRYWWGRIDNFFRQVQPFVQLKEKTQGARVLCTQFLTQPDIHITWAAYRQGHKKLAFVTIVTLIAKIAIVASGRLFEWEDRWIKETSSLSTTADWRNGSFSPIGNASTWEDIQRRTFAGSMSAFSPLQGWSSSPHTFIPVEIPEGNKNYTATLDAISSSLDCSEVKTQLTPSSNGAYKAWSFSFASKSCSTGSIQLNVCKDVFISPKKEISSSNGGCYTWTLLPKAACNGVEDFWLINVATSPSSIQIKASNATGSGDLLFSAQPNTLSMLCRPKYTKDTVSTSISRADFDHVTLHPIKILSSVPLELSSFMSQNGPPMDFSAYFATQLNSSSLVSKIFLAASGVAINPISAIMVFNMVCFLS